MPTKQELSKINAGLATGDLKPLKGAIFEFGRKDNFRNFAKAAGVRRESLYRALQSDGGIGSEYLFKILDAAGLKLQVVLKD